MIVRKLITEMLVSLAPIVLHSADYAVLSLVSAYQLPRAELRS